MRKHALSLLLIYITLGTLNAQRLDPVGSFLLSVDVARFRYDETKTYLEAYYGFYPRLVTYTMSNGRFKGAVHLTTKLTNKVTGEIVVNTTSVLPLSIQDTSATTNRNLIVSQAGYAIPFGEYSLEVLAVDSIASSRRDSVAIDISARARGDGIWASDPELCSNIISSTNSSDAFYKNSLEVIPNPTLLFGVMTYPVLFYYYELYGVPGDREMTLQAQIVDGKGAVVRESSKQKKFSASNVVEVGTVNVSSLESARYIFRATATDASGAVKTRSEKTFYVFNPHIQAAAVTDAAAMEAQLVGLTSEEMADEFRKCQYIATDQHNKLFAQLTKPEAQRQFLAQFWADAEKGIQGRPPIKRPEYLQRVAVANQRYSAFSKEGWRTDRGRVLILYGEPDQIDRHPSSESRKPHEIWNYYQLENGVEFVFVDRSGFGEYAQVHSTKRGELRDEQWQRYLY